MSLWIFLMSIIIKFKKYVLLEDYINRKMSGVSLWNTFHRNFVIFMMIVSISTFTTGTVIIRY